MFKNFKEWHSVKESVNNKLDHIPYFDEGDIWWVHMGVNIGYEIDGKGKNFERPVLIIKKYGRNSFLCVPLSSKVENINKYKLYIGKIKNKDCLIHISQIKNFDSRRLINKIHHLEAKLFLSIKQKISTFIFADFL